MDQENKTPQQAEQEGENEEGGAWYLMPIGLCLGVALGIALDNLALWMSIGICVGVALSGIGSKRNKKGGRP